MNEHTLGRKTDSDGASASRGHEIDAFFMQGGEHGGTGLANRHDHNLIAMHLSPASHQHLIITQANIQTVPHREFAPNLTPKDEARRS